MARNLIEKSRFSFFEKGHELNKRYVLSFAVFIPSGRHMEAVLSAATFCHSDVMHSLIITGNCNSSSCRYNASGPRHYDKRATTVPWPSCTVERKVTQNGRHYEPSRNDKKKTKRQQGIFLTHLQLFEEKLKLYFLRLTSRYT